MSREEEEQYVAKFTKILENLEENALSYLFQRGVFQGDASYRKYEQRVNDESLRDGIIKNLLRPDGKTADDDDSLKQIATLLQKLCSEASQMFMEISQNSSRQNSVRSAVIALGFHLALIDRITARLNLPSINDKAFWRLLSAKTPPPSASPPSPVTNKNLNQKNFSTPSSVSTPSINVAKSAARSESKTQPHTTKPEVNSKPTHAGKSKEPLSKPKMVSQRQPPKPDIKKNRISPVRQEPPANVKNTSAKTVSAKTDSTPQIDANTAKPEGPIKAMLRRIVKEIKDESYDAVIGALKDHTLMTTLYKTADDPISVKIIEVNSKERVVHLIKQKMGQSEPVTFRLIRKLLTELYPPDS